MATSLHGEPFHPYLFAEGHAIVLDVCWREEAGAGSPCADPSPAVRRAGFLTELGRYDLTDGVLAVPVTFED